MDTASSDLPIYLPKEPKDLPRPELDLPLPEKELPAHTSEMHTNDEPAQETEYEQLYDVKTLLAWDAPGRPFRERGKEFFATVIVITFLIEIIVFLFGEYLLMIVILSFVFVVFALVLVPPHNYHYKISSEGVTIEDHFYLWQELYDFYFKRRENQDILHIRTKVLLPGELTITLGDIHKEQLQTILIQYLPYRELVNQTLMEKSGNWLSNTFPLEKKKTQP